MRKIEGSALLTEIIFAQSKKKLILDKDNLLVNTNIKVVSSPLQYGHRFAKSLFGRVT